MKKKSNSSEQASHQSAAEFFSEHQQIAGFDNPAKSLFTTIRELVENSLDAAESIHVYPTVSVKIIEYTEEEHNKRHGIHVGGKSTKKITTGGDSDDDEEFTSQSDTKSAPPKGKQQMGRSSSTSSNAKDSMYYDIECRDNGCGISSDQIGELLGRVLSGSKHGVRQTRGKFGLGAKMALIWSKKSSGLPIRIRSAHCTDPNGEASAIETVVLDMDIQRNQPKILSRSVSKLSSSSVETEREDWRRGLEMGITIGGAWSSCRSRVLQYFQQLAVITPYADLTLSFESLKDPKKNFQAEFVRRSEQMPPTAGTVLPHAKSVNNITLSALLREFALCSSAAPSVDKFLCTAIAGIPPKAATTMADSLGIRATRSDKLSASQVAALCQVLRDDPHVRPPSAQCLSPAGEYNLRLGVLKELKPRLVATYTDKPGVHEGHSFLVEAAVSLGGSNIREGINIFRFANRIPLLFEPGADVVTQVATRRIKWSSYLMDPKRDSIGVYVSIVSTRIPFKGTSKEYIGDDVLEIQYSVKRALMGCCQQMRIHLAESQAKREVHERRKALLRYIPDISSSLVTVLQKVSDRMEDSGEGSGKWGSLFSALEQSAPEENSTSATQRAKAKRKGAFPSDDLGSAQKRQRAMSDSRLVSKLTETAHKVSNVAAGMDEAGGGAASNTPGDKKGTTDKKSSSQSSKEMYLALSSQTQPPLPPVALSLVSQDIHSTVMCNSGSEGRWVALSGIKTGAIFVAGS